MDDLIYFLSDVHEDINFSGLKKYVEIATDKDLLIILGDVGLNFTNTEENKLFSENFLSINKKIAFIEGNHENFGYINSFPVVKWNGGLAHKLTDNIVHLIRGNIYTIDGLKFFTFGGCKSSQKWKDAGLWFFGEEATEEELSFAVQNLKNNENSVDYILTHKYENGAYENQSLPLLNLCDYLDKKVKFNKWLSGHWHREFNYDEKHICIYDRLISIKEL